MLKYADYADVFLYNLAIKLLENMSINEHIIKLENNKQSLHGLIYSQDPVKPKTIKTDIKSNFQTGFIWLFKCLIGAEIFYNKKPNGSFQLYVNYQSLNNLTMKNQYQLPLIKKLLDQLN